MYEVRRHTANFPIQGVEPAFVRPGEATRDRTSYTDTLRSSRATVYAPATGISLKAGLEPAQQAETYSPWSPHSGLTGPGQPIPSWYRRTWYTMKKHRNGIWLFIAIVVCAAITGSLAGALAHPSPSVVGHHGAQNTQSAPAALSSIPSPTPSGMFTIVASASTTLTGATPMDSLPETTSFLAKVSGSLSVEADSVLQSPVPPAPVSLYIALYARVRVCRLTCEQNTNPAL